MRIKQLSLFLENRNGSVNAVCQVLKQNKINIKTLSLADTQQFGILRLLVQNPEECKVILEKAGFVVKVTEVLALLVPDHPGGLADILAILDRHQLSIEYMYAFTFGREDQAVIVFRFENPELAVKELKNEPITILRAEELFQ